MVINNIGISILPKVSILNELDLGLLKYAPIDDENFFREFSLVLHKDKIFNNNIKNLSTSR